MMTSCHKEIQCHNKELLPDNNERLPDNELFTHKNYLSSKSEILFHNNDFLSFINGILSHNNEVLSHNDKLSNCFASSICTNTTEVRDFVDSKQTVWIPLLNATLNVNLQIVKFPVVLEESSNIKIHLQQPALVETKEAVVASFMYQQLQTSGKHRHTDRCTINAEWQ